jgi:hypothetical protein
MVKDVVQAGFVLEDITGEIEVMHSGNDISANDVLGVKGHVREGKLFASELVWPDISLSRPMHRIAGAALVLTECPDKAPKDTNLLLSSVKAPGMQAVQSPGWATITKDKKGIAILSYIPGTDADPKEWLKKRCLPLPKKAIPGSSNPFVLDPVPDILWVIGSEQKKEVYKGVLIVYTGKGSARINLETMEATFT